jgi:methyl-accepting chemotaxis protein
MKLDHAISKHIEWKVKFFTAILRHETMDTETISKDNCCELGKWLHEDGKAQFENLASYSICLDKHAAFHIEAGKIAAKINEKKFNDAEAMLNAGQPYTTSSNDLNLAIKNLENEANQKNRGKTGI